MKRIACGIVLACTAGTALATGLEIKVLSSRPDLVSGGDALIAISTPADTRLEDLSFTLNGKVVKLSLARDQDSGTFRGLIDNLRNGKNELVAAARSAKARLQLTNYPIAGPILSGPHLTPYECRTVESGLGEPLDADCSATTRVDNFYRATDGTFKPLPAGPRPADVVYVVQVESGTINRTIYRIAMPATGWNRKLAVAFGGGSGTQYNQGVNQAKDALSDLYLSRGFAFMVATELVNQLHSNAVLQGETLMMLKEHFIERYGTPKWTVGHGGSGGAIQQQLITEIYPGLLDGLQPTASFPDSSLHTADCGLLQNFWRKADASIWTDAKKMAVEGYTTGTCAAWERSFVPVLTATNARGCALQDASKVYDPIKNPKGARCTVQEMRANVYGRDPKTGFARKPQDNVGLQYGLGALNSGAISVEEFLDLNERIGGNDIDGNFVAQRSVGDPLALRALYASGLMNSGGGGLANVPILHARGYTDAIGDIHDRERDFTIRARLQRANGRADNQVIWIGPRGGSAAQSSRGAVDLAALSLDTMTRWLDAIADDPAPLTPDKVVRHKPPEAVDACWTEQGERIVEQASFDARSRCNTLYPVHGEPRLIAGAPLTNDIVKCQLKPIDYASYQQQFSAGQKQRLAAIFPNGVCDYSRPGVEQVALRGTYQRY
jgi:hypothetical protein